MDKEHYKLEEQYVFFYFDSLLGTFAFHFGFTYQTRSSVHILYSLCFTLVVIDTFSNSGNTL